MPVALIKNYSQIPVFGGEQRFYNGHQFNFIVAKCTFALIPGKALKPLLDQPQIVFDDLTEGDKDFATTRYPSDLIAHKPKVDVVVVGQAEALNGTPEKEWLANISVGKWEKTLKLTGPRFWERSGIGSWRLTEPQPATQVPLLYELAYGGTVGPYELPKEYFEQNQLGQGFIADGEHISDSKKIPAPQIEYLDSPISLPNANTRVAGFAPVPDYFESRSKLSGTWDAKWEKTTAPNIPLDMDLRFWNCAPEDQQLEALDRDARVTLIGMLAEGRVDFELPNYRPRAILYRTDEDTFTRELFLDTLHIDLDTRRVTLRWSLLVDFDEEVSRIHLIAPEAKLSS